MSSGEKRLSALQKDILIRLLTRVLGQRAAKVPPWISGPGIRLSHIRPKGVARAKSAAFSRALARLERRGLVVRNNVATGIPTGPLKGRQRVKAEEPPPRRTDHVILTPAGEDAAKRLTNSALTPDSRPG
jgi:hypothetical protein